MTLHKASAKLANGETIVPGGSYFAAGTKLIFLQNTSMYRPHGPREMVR